MNRYAYIAPLLIGGAILFSPFICRELHAQNKSQISASIYASSIFRDTNPGLFDASSFSISYSRELEDYINGFIDLSALTAIHTSAVSNMGLERFSLSLVSLNAGLDLALVDARAYLFTIGVGGGLRNRKEVSPFAAIQPVQDNNFTLDEYINTIDYGALIQMKHSVHISPSVSLGLVSRFQIYNEGDSVFDVGITIGKHF